MTIIDVSKLAAAKSDQLNAVDLIGGCIQVKITNVTVSEGSDQPVIVHYENDNGKPFKPCKTMIRVLMHAYGNDASQWIGNTLELYCDDSVKWAGKAHGGVRISAMDGIKSQLQLMLPVTRGKKVMHTIRALDKAVGEYHNYKLILEKAAINGIKSLSDAWSAMPKDVKAGMNDIKDKCKKIAVESDEAMKKSSMTPPAKKLVTEVESAAMCEAPKKPMDQF